MRNNAFWGIGIGRGVLLELIVVIILTIELVFLFKGKPM
jgi:hypothetical protein